MPVKSGTKLVMLGTGTPNVHPERFGSSMAVVCGPQAYLVDFGSGILQRAQAAYQMGIEALALPRITIGLLTHLHSDHTLGYPDLILAPWVLGRKVPLKIFGPAGLESMTGHILAAYNADIRERLDGLEPANQTGIKVEVTEIESGLVFEDSYVKVTAFPVQHGSWPAFGYRFETEDGVIVISGDTAPTESLIEAAYGCDILVHEVYAGKYFDRRPPEWQRYHKQVHTSSLELGSIAKRIGPELLVLTHQLYWGATDKELLAEVESIYDGVVISAHDLDIFECGNLKRSN